jgi:dTDP-4-amino-4,6-dideoxygalactose transaminase
VSTLPRSFGGELELGTLDVGRSAGRFGSGPRRCEVATGRTAIVIAARAAAAQRPGPALVPSYVCVSVVRAIREAGLAVRYYAVDGSLGTPIDALMQASERWSPSLTLVVNYFGFPAAPAIFAALRRGRRGGAIVEDCAHGSWLESANPPVGARGDFVFTSFRKYLSVPDGGILQAPAGVRLPALPEGDDEFVRLRLAAKLLRGERLRGAAGPDAERLYLELFERAERGIDRRVPMAGMSSVSSALVAQEDLARVKARRRSNFNRLLAAIRRAPARRLLAPIFDRLPDGVSPLALPVRVSRGARDRVRRRLAAARVFCPVHWPLPPGVAARFPESARLSADILSLPIDQRYDADAVDELADRVASACRELA